MTPSAFAPVRIDLRPWVDLAPPCRVAVSTELVDANNNETRIVLLPAIQSNIAPPPWNPKRALSTRLASPRGSLACCATWLSEVSSIVGLDLSLSCRLSPSKKERRPGRAALLRRSRDEYASIRRLLYGSAQIGANYL